MSRWVHAICEGCWQKRHPEGREPVRVRTKAICCYCDAPTHSGIFTRDDPAKVPCHGMGPEHED